MIDIKKLKPIVEKFHKLEQELLEANGLKFNEISKDLGEISQIANLVIAYEKNLKDLAEYRTFKDDPELGNFAEIEIPILEETIQNQEQELKLALLPKDEADVRNAILEIRPAAGGEEAAIFGADLLRMYQRYCELKGWKFEILEIQTSGVGGVKSAQMAINGRSVYGRLKFESGVHRVQRVPETEASGRIHTSTATVAVLPEAEEVDVKIEEKDLRIDVFRSSGPGGQSVNTTDSAVRITHIPTGLVVQQQDEKSQHKNKAKALRILRARLFEIEREKQAKERSNDRNQQVGSGERSEKIRTYNFPQGRVTDHRINLTVYRIESMMNGEILDEFIDALQTEQQAKILAQENND